MSNQKQISNAISVATKAKNIFITTINELKKSNQILIDVVKLENEEICKHQDNILLAETHLKANSIVIKNIEGLVE